MQYEMSKHKIYQFLRALAKNNSKEWMHANKKQYLEAKAIFLAEVEQILVRIQQHDPSLATVEPKKSILRINTNRRFHPNKPIYRDHFGFAPISDMYLPSFYLHVSPKETFIGGGLYKPPTESLNKVRAAIDYDGERLNEIVANKRFQAFYGGWENDPDLLKTSPRAYPKDHRHIDLLRRKNFTALRPITQAEFVRSDFVEVAEEAFVRLQPLNAYLKQAIEFEE
jgi:uncharacterized protein (TIGR02453 family)